MSECAATAAAVLEMPHLSLLETTRSQRNAKAESNTCILDTLFQCLTLFFI